MPSHRNFSEDKTLEIYSTTLHNARKNDDIRIYMESVGYDLKKIAAGEALLEKTYKDWRTSSSKKFNYRDAYQSFTRLRKSVSESYSLHRKIARVAFKSNKMATDSLALNTPVPKAHGKWMEQVKNFYENAAGSSKILAKLAEYKLDEEKITSVQAEIRKIEDKRADYIQKKAISYAATKKKDASFDELYEWMKDFYAMAKIAHRHDKKLMASFNKGAAITR